MQGAASPCGKHQSRDGAHSTVRRGVWHGPRRDRSAPSGRQFRRKASSPRQRRCGTPARGLGLSERICCLILERTLGSQMVGIRRTSAMAPPPPEDSLPLRLVVRARGCRCARSFSGRWDDSRRYEGALVAPSPIRATRSARGEHSPRPAAPSRAPSKAAGDDPQERSEAPAPEAAGDEVSRTLRAAIDSGDLGVLKEALAKARSTGCDVEFTSRVSCAHASVGACTVHVVCCLWSVVCCSRVCCSRPLHLPRALAVARLDRAFAAPP